MRKDVRIGLAIGGVLFSGVMAYVLFFTSDKKDAKKPVASDTTTQPSAQVAQSGGADAARVTSPARTETTAPSPVRTPSDPSNVVSMGGGTPPVAPVTPPEPVITPPTPTPGPLAITTPDTTITSMGGGTGTSIWGDALDRGIAPALIARTETPTRRIGLTPPPVAIGLGGTNTVSDPATRPAGRTYAVKTGETYWRIAEAEYGNGAYFNHLIRVNPKFPPNRLKAGDVIIIPDRSEVTAGTATTTGAARTIAARPTTRPTDPASEYRVQAGDNLHVISKKLYGKADRVDKLYQLNKEAIGPNPAALKLNMVLKLPEPPTSPATVAGTHQ